VQGARATASAALDQARPLKENAMPDTSGPDTSGSANSPQNIFGEMLKLQTEATQTLLSNFGNFAPGTASGPDTVATDPTELAHWAGVAQRMQALWLEFQSEKLGQAVSAESISAGAGKMFADPSAWLGMI